MVAGSNSVDCTQPVMGPLTSYTGWDQCMSVARRSRPEIKRSPRGGTGYCSRDYLLLEQSRR